MMIKQCFILLGLITGLNVLQACKSNHTNENKNALTNLVNNPASANGTDTVSAARKPVMTFTRDTLHDFGPIQQGEVVSYEFPFTNTGKTPLVITNAYGSCGCTVPEFPKQPIEPGTSSIIKVTFSSAGKEGQQTKTVYIRTNTLRSTENLYIKALVNTGNKNK